MNTIRSSSNKEYIIKCAAVCLTTALVIFVPFIIAGKGFFTICDDFNFQQIPFSIDLNRILKAGPVSGWTWNYDLGVSTIQGFSFYALGSPFFWITMFFPADRFPYLCGWIYVLKYAIAGIFAFLFLQRFVNNKNAAIIGAITYAFSGYQATNLEFYHFHDVVAFFPLLLYSLEEMLDNPEKKHLFVFSVFVNCLLNYYFFVQEAIFLIIYFLFRFMSCDYKKFFRNVLLCIECGIWGIGMAAVLFIPNILYVAENPRASAIIDSSDFKLSITMFTHILKGLLLPGEAMNAQSSITRQCWDSASAWLPMVGILPATTYCISKRDRISGLIIFLVICSFFPLLNSLFLLFSESSFRWWYMFSIIMSVATVKLFDEADSGYRLEAGAILSLLAVIGFGISIYWADCSERYNIVFDLTSFVFYSITSAFGILITYITIKKQRLQTALILVSIFSVVSTGFTLVSYTRPAFSPSSNKTAYSIGQSLMAIDDQFRYNILDNRYSLSGESASAMQTFSSTPSMGSKEFDSLFDYQSPNLSLNKNSIPGVAELLGAKYVLTEECPQDYLYSTVNDGRTFYIYETDACPIGFAMDSYILYEDLMSYSKEDRGTMLLNAAVISADDESLVSFVASRFSFGDTVSAIDDAVYLNNQNSVSDFSRDYTCFRCVSNYDRNRIVYFSVPYDRGWTAKIDGQCCDIIDSGGMMLLYVPAGEHQIVFSYCTPGYRTGLVISAVSMVAFLSFSVLTIISKKRRALS